MAVELGPSLPAAAGGKAHPQLELMMLQPVQMVPCTLSSAPASLLHLPGAEGSPSPVLLQEAAWEALAKQHHFGVSNRGSGESSRSVRLGPSFLPCKGQGMTLT